MRWCKGRRVVDDGEETAFIGIPLQKEIEGRGAAQLFERDAENGIAEASGKTCAIRQGAQAGGGWIDAESDDRAACLFRACLPEDEERHAGGAGPHMQAPAFG